MGASGAFGGFGSYDRKGVAPAKFEIAGRVRVGVLDGFAHPTDHAGPEVVARMVEVDELAIAELVGRQRDGIDERVVHDATVKDEQDAVAAPAKIGEPVHDEQPSDGPVEAEFLLELT